MVLNEQLLTVEEFWEIAQLPENENRRLELEDGIIVEIAPSKPTNTVVAIRIAHFLMSHVTPDNLGIVSGSDGGFKLDENTTRQPDVAYVPMDKVKTMPDNFDFAPALAVEVVSPNEDVFKKTNEYLDAGTQIVWAVYCNERKVFVFTRDENGILRSEPKHNDDILDGGDVLPDFRLPVKDIFPPNLQDN